MTIRSIVRLKPGRENSILRFHPWVFSGGIQSIDNEPVDGDWVEVQNHQKRTLGFGHYQKGTITVRMIVFGEEIPTDTIWAAKITKAYLQRRATNVVSAFTNGFRLVHGEGDGLPGLIVDLYNKVAVVQAHSAGMHNDRHKISDAIREVLGDDVTAVYYKSPSVGKIQTENEYLFGMAAVPHIMVEHGNQFFVDWEEGQKTGFFLDQRENRKLLGEFCDGKKVLNTFCYTGGFSVYALQNKAKVVHSVDASEKAIELTRKNLELNGFSAEDNGCFAEDTFDFIRDKQGEYDVIVLDPPAFAKHKEAKHQAMKGYQRLNAEAMRIIKPGGVIFTFSCSQVVDRQLFYDTIVSSAIQAKRSIKVLHHLSQPADHPVSIFHPEGEYLKGLVLWVE
ncbi:MAG: class I SAM-dependent rRNA methyltransferase [Bacteroidota bacterium]|jgi:23S rRNA (cytosine1962-C5)-methyltransferase|nr:class I SAM-dependent rRNA methyltransferase [Cytophagales bacterium]